ncbi:aminoglycoside adenylyltransferase domain-containing protein [Nocardioides sp. W7]|uniref:aminoglycoside adenylyltransferase domain-containing protein n=1 Tax=Nocardioides sp. W7 TaxID=2931390 RepID=UPI001FCFEEFE|nr:aminoglycoside adenylyltransferase domain-containing protein [Nocardioides sp. W7]
MSSVEEHALAACSRLADECAAILQRCLVSAILHGSLTQDDFRPGLSDIDLLLIVDRALTSGQVDGLVSAVDRADLGPAGGVDLLVVTRQAAATPGEHPDRELMVGRWPGSDDQLEVAGREKQVSDLWPELSEIRANGRALMGPGPGEVIGEVPGHRVRANSVGWLRTWLKLTDDDKNAVHMVLTACRMWRFELTGEHTSKTAAARWALGREPSLTAVDLALLARATSHPRPIAPHDVEDVLRRVLRDLDGDAPD